MLELTESAMSWSCAQMFLQRFQSQTDISPLRLCSCGLNLDKASSYLSNSCNKDCMIKASFSIQRNHTQFNQNMDDSCDTSSGHHQNFVDCSVSKGSVKQRVRISGPVKGIGCFGLVSRIC